jgi:hypothetical protein
MHFIFRKKEVKKKIYSSNSTSRRSSAFLENLQELKSEYNLAQLNKSVFVLRLFFWWLSHKENSLELRDAYDFGATSLHKALQVELP